MGTRKIIQNQSQPRAVCRLLSLESLDPGILESCIIDKSLKLNPLVPIHKPSVAGTSRLSPRHHDNQLDFLSIDKEIFGGFGRNIFNPALAGRCFVYICFPVAMTAVWAPAATGPYGALQQWSTANTPDAITAATPMARTKAAGLELRAAKPEARQAAEDNLRDTQPSLPDLILGRISGTMGMTSALLITIGGLYLLFTKTASLRIVLSVILPYAALSQLLHALGVQPVPDALRAVLGGGFLFGAFFMATDPVSAAKTKWGQVIYGVLIAVFVVVIRNFSIFNGGLMFSILLGNMFAPIIDYMFEKPRVAKAGGGGA